MDFGTVYHVRFVPSPSAIEDLLKLDTQIWQLYARRHSCDDDNVSWVKGRFFRDSAGAQGFFASVPTEGGIRHVILPMDDFEMCVASIGYLEILDGEMS